jgi:hypothetical protein
MIVRDEFTPATGNPPHTASTTVTTLNMQNGVPLLALATLQLKYQILGCWWKISSSIILRTYEKVSDDNWTHANQSQENDSFNYYWSTFVQKKNLLPINQKNCLLEVNTTKKRTRLLQEFRTCTIHLNFLHHSSQKFVAEAEPLQRRESRVQRFCRKNIVVSPLIFVGVSEIKKNMIPANTWREENHCNLYKREKEQFWDEDYYCYHN